jgi:hypothetical protein
VKDRRKKQEEKKVWCEERIVTWAVIIIRASQVEKHNTKNEDALHAKLHSQDATRRPSLLEAVSTTFVAVEFVWPLAHPATRFCSLRFIKLSQIYGNKSTFLFLASLTITDNIYCSKTIQLYLKVSSHDSLRKLSR